MRRPLLFFIVILLFPAPAFAQPLADRVPADALLYVGWSGSQNVGPAFERSHLKAMVESSGARELFTQTLPQLSQRAAGGQAGVTEYVALLSAIGERVWRHPAALYWNGVDFSDPRNPRPRVTLICDAGDEAAALTKDFQTAIDRAGKTGVAVRIVPHGGNVVSLVIGPAPAAPDAEAAPAMLAGDAQFKAAMAQVHAAPVACAYANLGGIVQLIDAAPVRATAKRDRENWNKLRDALGLAGAKAAVWTGAFDGRDWSGRAFLAAPAPRGGILAMLDAKPVTDDFLKLVPETATMFRACNVDLGRVIPAVRATAGKVDPAAPANLDTALDRFRTMSGLDLQADVFEPLGDQWAVYADPTVGGNFSLSLVLVNRPDDAAKTERAIAQLARSIGNFASGAGSKDGVTVAFREVQHGDVTVHYLATPIVRPSWAIRDGVLYAGLYPQTVAAAAAAKGASGKSILDNAAYVAARKRLGDSAAAAPATGPSATTATTDASAHGNDVGGAGAAGAATSIQFRDLPKIAPTVYPAWLVLTSYAGFGDLFGVRTPPMLLPPLDDLLAHLAPAASVSWVDDAGWHARSVSPFPGANLVASDPTLTLFAPGLLGGVVAPSLGRGRDVAAKSQCGRNLHQVGRAIQLYANENKGAFPPDLGTLVEKNNLSIDLLVCPGTGEDVPPEIRSAPLDTQATWANTNAPYVYVGRGKTLRDPAATIICYERDENHGDGMNLLHADGHVEYHPLALAEQLIRAGAERK